MSALSSGGLGASGRRRPAAAPLQGPMLLPVPRTMTSRLCAVVLVGQAPLVLFGAFGARALALVNQPQMAGVYLWGGLALVALCIVAAMFTRIRLGILLGWVAQLATLASALVLTPMIVVSLIFGGLWIVALVQGRRMDDLTYSHMRATGQG